jgi:hypothetical protein
MEPSQRPVGVMPLLEQLTDLQGAMGCPSRELWVVRQIAQHNFIRPRLDRVNTPIWVIRRGDEEHQQSDHRGEQHAQERLCQQTLNVEEIRCKDRKRGTDEDHDP